MSKDQSDEDSSLREDYLQSRRTGSFERMSAWAAGAMESIGESEELIKGRVLSESSERLQIQIQLTQNTRYRRMQELKSKLDRVDDKLLSRLEDDKMTNREMLDYRDRIRNEEQKHLDYFDPRPPSQSGRGAPGPTFVLNNTNQSQSSATMNGPKESTLPSAAHPLSIQGRQKLSEMLTTLVAISSRSTDDPETVEGPRVVNSHGIEE